MQDASHSLSLPTERDAWRNRMSAVRDAVLGSNGPVQSMHPDDVKIQIHSYEQDVALLKMVIARMHYHISPLGRRPLTNEILRRIFMDAYLYNPCPRTALFISHVCRRWREVALNFPRLWTELELRRKEVDLTRLSEWAARAGGLPLKITVRCSPHTDQPALITWLRERSDRIKALTIRHLTLDRQSHLMNALPPLPRMTTLRLYGFDLVEVHTPDFMRVLAQSRAIVNLTLSGICGLQAPQSLQGFADGLVHLILGGVTQTSNLHTLGLGHALRLILPCASLRHLECHDIIFQPPGIDPVSLQHLVSLTIGDGAHTCAVLGHLRVPNLQTLHLVRRARLDRFERPVRQHDNVSQDYITFLVSCLRGLYANCFPKIRTIIWDHVPARVVDVLGQCIGSDVLRHLELLECRGLARLDLESFQFFLGPQGANSTRSLRAIIFTGCTIGPRGLRQAEEPMHLNRRITLGDIVKREGDNRR